MSEHSAENDVGLCGRLSGKEWECRAPRGHADGMHVWGRTDDALLFHSGWSERNPALTVPVEVDRATALRLLRDSDARATYAVSERAAVAALIETGRHNGDSARDALARAVERLAEYDARVTSPGVAQADTG